VNIFAFSPNQSECVKKLDDKRLNKMITETYQIISTVLHENYKVKLEKYGIDKVGTIEDMYGQLKLYRPTHKGHPVVKWAGETRGNYFWTVQYLRAACAEWYLRYRRNHAVAMMAEEARLDYSRLELENRSDSRTPFVNCARRKDMGIDYTNVEDVHEAYTQYIHHRWKLDKYPPKRGGVLITEHLDLMEALNGRL
jgi:hypothetical protein